jgi:hypothetical protein
MITIVNGQFGKIINKDGKYGIFDEKYGEIIAPECDKIESKPSWNGMFFILKKGEKYAFAYFRNLDSTGNFFYKYMTPHWEVSDFVYDELVSISHFAALRSKKNGKYGMIYIRTNFNCSRGFFTICSFDGLGGIDSTGAIYDEPFWYNDDGILNVKLEGKYRLVKCLDLLGSPAKWDMYTYPETFDSIAKYPNNRDPKHDYRLIKKDGKWGLVKINPVIKEIEYIVPCDCDTLLTSSYKTPNSPEKNPVFLCEKKAQQKAVIYYDSANSMDVSNINKPVFHFYIFYIDTIPNEKEEMHKKYVHITLGSYDIQSKIFSNKGQCLFDMQSGNTTFYIDDYNTTYEFFIGYHGIIIEKQTKTANGITYEYIDHETNSLKLTLKSNKKNISYRMSHTSRHGSTNDYLIIEMIKEKEGSKSYLDNDYSYKYYYDFRNKKFFKGKCKGCQ